METELSRIIKSKEELQERVELLQLLLDTIPYPMFYKDINGIFKECNSAFAKHIGLKRENIIGKSAYGISPKELADIYSKADKKLFKQKETRIYEANTKNKDGTKYSIVFNKAALTSDKGDRVGLAGMITDIMEKGKMYEKNLKEILKEYQKALDLFPEGVVIHDYKGKIEYVNENSVKLLKAENINNVVGKSIMDIINESDKDIVINNLSKVINNESVPYYPIKLKCFNGDIVDTEVAFILQNFIGRKYVLAILKNLFKQKVVEKERLKIEKLESIGLLAGGIAHDFNNILTIIQGNISLTKLDIKENKYDNLYSRMKEIEKAVQQSKNLTQQLLTFSKGGDPVKEAVSIEELIKETTALALCGSNVRCEYLFSEDLYPVEIDKGQISQVINNLIINSVHAMPEGGTIKIGVENSNINNITRKMLPLKDGKYIKIFIQDEGIGIPQKYIQKIFDPYFTTKQEGSGLGLATSFSIVKKHNGYLFVESEVGYGSIFYIYLPAVFSNGVLRKAEKEVIKGKGRILFMDDSDLIREVTGEMLNELGYDVCFAENGVQAVELYKKDNYDAVIMDLTIPGGAGGKWAINILKKVDPKIKAIVISGYANDHVISNYKEYGFSGYLIKPYEIEDLSKIVYRVIK
jgi:PAS domain S-box-containing protein